jgi:RsiW-degrading membrane proteinase PrsW (M82 family)
VWIPILVGVCAAGAAILVRRHDMYDREPWWALLGTVALGAVLMPACGVAEDLCIFAGTSTPSSLWIAANAAFFEGLARVVVTGAVAHLLPRVFNDPMDGITYGSMAGLGMALYESGMYLGAGSAGGAEVARLFAHLVLGGISGFPFGMWRMGMRGWRRAFLVCGTGAFLLHWAIDAAALRAVARPEFLDGATVVVCGAVAAATLAYGALAVEASAWSRALFAPFSLERLLRWPLDLF